MNTITITEHEFSQFQRFIYENAGIHLSPAKKALVCGRLARRVQHCRLRSYGEYFDLLKSGGARDEVQTAIDLLTTNETYFFREPKHFEQLRDCIAQTSRPGHSFRVWSAACSSGEEVYSIAMVLADRLGDGPWEVVGSDISTRVLARAQTAHYPLERTRYIPPEFLRKYCLKGHGPQEGTLLVERRLRARISFLQVNLNEELPALGSFDVIFLRNVMIYFNMDTKRQIVGRVLSLLRPGGHFFISHSESLHGVTDEVRSIRPSLYRKP